MMLKGHHRVGHVPIVTNARIGKEIKAILTDPEVGRDVDREALDAYLTLGYTPAPATGFAPVRQLEPGQCALVDAGGVRVSTYWSIPYRESADTIPFPEAVAQFTALLDRITAAQFVADVPVGAFLSGGLDSAAIVRAMTRAAGATSTLTVGFDVASFDERPAAKTVAERLGVPFTSQEVTLDAADLFPRAVSPHGRAHRRFLDAARLRLGSPADAGAALITGGQDAKAPAYSPEQSPGVEDGFADEVGDAEVEQSRDPVASLIVVPDEIDVFRDDSGRQLDDDGIPKAAAELHCLVAAPEHPGLGHGDARSGEQIVLRDLVVEVPYRPPRRKDGDPETVFHRLHHALGEVPRQRQVGEPPHEGVATPELIEQRRAIRIHRARLVASGLQLRDPAFRERLDSTARQELAIGVYGDDGHLDSSRRVTLAKRRD